jgi:hypothetical protein
VTTSNSVRRMGRARPSAELKKNEGRSETHRDNCVMRWVSQGLNPSYVLTSLFLLALVVSSSGTGRTLSEAITGGRIAMKELLTTGELSFLASQGLAPEDVFDARHLPQMAVVSSDR